ncbi:unnamed protein product [Darwinula stevensoni]|uniref:rRNA methyltransferase 1, mitochondrial n=1 Tax=Darwinula stevensoni TaxID=69355 RepID=A0A7R8X360_9CRUS|nr:unnamed protein product [Darwinula stevensoni]CAG0882003.1 unnamed protein product [Darwinula stevensoni]
MRVGQHMMMVMTSCRPQQRKKIQARINHPRQMPLPKIIGELIYGVHPVSLALERGQREIYCVYHKSHLQDSPILDRFHQKGIPIIQQTVENFRFLLGANTVHQNANYECPTHFLTFHYENKGCALSGTVSKASSGALEVMSLFREGPEGMLGILRCLKETHGWKVYATSIQKHSSVPLVDVENLEDLVSTPRLQPSLVIFGNERSGVTSAVTKEADACIAIRPGGLRRNRDGEPATSAMDSLNVSVAAGIILSRFRSCL